jgi:hypothetical protein
MKTVDTDAVSDRQAQLDGALGYMVRRAAMTEFFLHQAIKKLIRSRYTSLVTASLSASGALDLIQRIVDAAGFGQEASQELKRIVDIARAAFTERNRYVHGVRVIVEDQDILLIRNRRKGGLDRLTTEVDELRQLGEEFGQLSGMIVDWTQRHVDVSRGSRQKNQISEV